MLRGRYAVHKMGQPAAEVEDHSLSQSIADEGAAVNDTTDEGENNYLVSLDQGAIDRDLIDADGPPVLDLILHDQTALGLPVLFATNREEGRFDDCIP